MINVNKKILKKIFRERPKDAKKYDFGLLLVIGGSEFYSGSPALSALAAFRAGVDMVIIIAPKRAADIIASFGPDLATFPLKGEHLKKEDLATLLSMTESAKIVSNNKTAVVIGGGIGRTPEIQETILEYLSKNSLPTVIDADAIHAISKNPKVIYQKPFLITPHIYEFFILTGKEVYQLPIKEKIKIVKQEAERLKTTILLKGKIDIISDGKRVAINRTGNPFMTKGGTGDTLAGIAGSLLARGTDLFLAAQAGAYINGFAGQLAAKKLGEGLMATDLIEEIPKIIK